MYSKEEKQFHAMNLQLRVELGEIERQIDDLEDRRVKIIALLDGNADISEEDEEGERAGTGHYLEDLVKFLQEYPGSSRKNIGNYFDSFYDLDDNGVKRLLEKGKRQGLIINTGRGRSSVWYATEEK